MNKLFHYKERKKKKKEHISLLEKVSKLFCKVVSLGLSKTTGLFYAETMH